MTKEEKETIKQEIREEFRNGRNGVFKKIMIGTISMIIAGSIGSFLGVIMGQKIDRERINQNTKRIEKIEKRTNQEVSRIQTSIDAIKSEQIEQWKYIIKHSNNTKGNPSIFQNKKKEK